MKVTQALRSLLFVPADSPKKIDKARQLRPDGILLDLEDGVSAQNKLQARALLSRELANFSRGDTRIFVRVNAVESPLFAADLDVAVHPIVSGVAIPKSESRDQIVRTDALIRGLEKERGLAGGRIGLLLFLESPAAVLNAWLLAQAADRVTSLLFGGEDYAAHMGISRTKSGEELLYARSAIAHAAHACGLEALDTVFTDLGDDAALLDETRRVRQLGFTGKLLIHPRQIDLVHEAFAPDAKEIAWAEEIVRAFEAVPGSGIVVAAGQMVDQPVALQARRILARRDRERASASGAN